jgi:F-type H+-transporting ATPase subunit epsilon
MKLVVATPLAVVVEADHVAHVRAEDDSGAFGILPGHADFLTVLGISVLTWRGGDGVRRHVALRGGMLEVRGGDNIRVTTREAVPGDDLGRLESEVVAAFRREVTEEKAARLDAQRLYLAAVRQIQRYLRTEAPPAWRGGSLANPLKDGGQ